MKDIQYIPVKLVNDVEKSDSFEIDVKGLIKKLWVNKIKIVIITFLFGVFGFVFAISSVNEFTSSSKILPDLQSQGSNLGRFGGIAAQFGIGGFSNNTQSDVLSSAVYPEILSSVDLLEPIIDKKVFLESINDSVSVKNYFLDHTNSNLILKYTIGLPGLIIKAIRGNSESVEVIQDTYTYKRLNTEDFGSINSLRNSITVNRDIQTGLVSISVTTQDREISVQILNLVLDGLKNYLISYRTEKAQQNLEFIQSRFDEIRLKYESAQVELAKFTDQNQGNLSNRALLIRSNLESEFNLYFNLYSSIAEQLEQAKIKLQQDTPLLSVIQQPMYPIVKSSTSKMNYLIIITFLGFIVSVTYVLMSERVFVWVRELKS